MAWRGRYPRRPRQNSETHCHQPYFFLPVQARDIDVKTIGAALGTRYILEGSVRKAGTRVRITAQLIDTVDGTHRWAETYIKGNPLYRNVAHDPRYTALLRKMNLPE